MTFLDGLRSGLGLPPLSDKPGRTVEASALLAPVAPAPELASPWADRSALHTMVWSDILGVEAADLPMTRADAMAIPAVSRSRSILCTTLGRLDLGVFDLAGKPSTAPCSTLIAQLDPHQSRYVQLVWTVDDLIFNGVSWYLVLARYAEDDRPRYLRRILPGGVAVDGGQVTVYGKPTPARDVVRIDGPHEGILNFASRSLRIAAKLEASAARFADNPVPAVELHQVDDRPMSEPEIDTLIARWAAARRGANGGVAYTSRSIEAKVHGAPAEHLLTSGRNAQAIDVARHIGVPADTIDASPERASMTYANREMRLGVLVDFGLAAYGSAITARLSMADITPAGLVVEFDYGNVTAASDADPDTAPPAAPAAPPAQETTP